MPELQQYESHLVSGNGTIAGTVSLRAFNSNRMSIMIQNLGTATLYVGGSAVSTSTGLQVLPSGQITLDRSNGGAIYCTATGTASVRFIEEVL